MGNPKTFNVAIFSTDKFNSGDRARCGLSPESKSIKKEYVERKF